MLLKIILQKNLFIEMIFNDFADMEMVFNDFTDMFWEQSMKLWQELSDFLTKIVRASYE